MQVTISSSDVKREKIDVHQLRNQVETWIERHLKRQLQSIRAWGQTLVITVRRQSKGERQWIVQLRLTLPGKKTAVAKGKGLDLWVAVENALKRLSREVERHVSRVTGREEYRRIARRERLRSLKAKVDALPHDLQVQQEKDMAPWLDKLREIARQELTYLRATGDLDPSYPELEDVVAETLCRVQLDWKEDRDDQALMRQLVRTLYQVLDEEISSRLKAPVIPIEEEVSKDARDQAEEMVQEEIYEFYQTDEALRWEDVISDPKTEAQVPEISEEETEVLRSLKLLPRMWRRAIILAQWYAWEKKDIAEVLDTSEETVEGWIVKAGAFVEARLTELYHKEETGAQDDLARLAIRMGKRS